jgi:hypothetical protein
MARPGKVNTESQIKLGCLLLQSHETATRKG